MTGTIKKYSYLPGAMLLAGALLRSAVTGIWDGLDSTVAGSGAAIVVASVIWNWRDIRAWFSDPRGMFAVGTFLSTFLLVGVLGLVNVIAWYRPGGVDLTASRRNSISRESRDLVASLDVEVALRQFGQAQDPAVGSRLASLAALGPMVTVVQEDVEASPQVARDLGVRLPGTVIVAAGSSYRKVENPTEQALVTAILQVTAPEQYRVCFVTGHGERGMADSTGQGVSGLVSVLEAANYQVAGISLLDAGALGDCSVLLLVGPGRDFAQAEIDHLETYMNTGGRLAVMLDPDPESLPTLDSWVGTWGVEPRAGIVVDESGAGQTVGGGPTSPLALHYNDHPIVRGFGIATMYGGARPLGILPRSVRGGSPVAVALTGDRSYVETNRSAGIAYDPDTDEQGPAPLVAANEVKVAQPPPNPPALGRIVVVGDADFTSNALLARQGNRDFMLRTLSWLVGEAEARIVSVEAPENRRIDLTEETRLWMYVVNLGILPLLPLLAGVVVYFRLR